MAKMFSCTCRLECEAIELADGSRMWVCVSCETYLEVGRDSGRLSPLNDKPIGRRSARRSASPRKTARAA